MRWAFRVCFFAASTLFISNSLPAQDDGFCEFPVPGEVVCDDFSDGSVTDGIPARWGMIGGTRTIEEESLVITATSPAFPWIRLAQPESVFSDISMRAQVRQIEGGQIGFAVRYNPGASRSSYGGFIWDDRAVIGVGGSSGGVIAETPISFDATANDLLLQFDAIGDELSLWVWPVGEPMPIAPTVSVIDDTLTSGQMFLWAGQGVGNSSVATGAYRYVQVGTQSIPEPSSALLLGTGLAACFAARRRSRRN